MEGCTIAYSYSCLLLLDRTVKIYNAGARHWFSLRLKSGAYGDYITYYFKYWLISLLIFYHLVWYTFFHSVMVIVNTSVPMSLKTGEVCKPSVH